MELAEFHSVFRSVTEACEEDIGGSDMLLLSLERVAEERERVLGGVTSSLWPAGGGLEGA